MHSQFLRQRSHGLIHLLLVKLAPLARRREPVFRLPFSSTTAGPIMAMGTYASSATPFSQGKEACASCAVPLSHAPRSTGTAAPARRSI